ncbi:mechanosensitive ion channel family protein [Pelagicoccus sp. SDUM812003]|uniref:mechanosensitive ion channel family protein n=1 Tax=Pelagicoccus sp. SDUM812003 TaxID=3041267 RepID=UPI00280F3AB2|nr:mechanosensitive ion channel family protein [Pelagicoccus sp. SDUM812003]MDQ8205210.1 mechanosensitive ion channel family protein [Pelagicoccus sp. SDUM812003]
MPDLLKELFEQHYPTVLKAALAAALLIVTFVSLRIYKRYIYRTGEKHRFAVQRTDAISKLGQALIGFVSIFIVSNVLGFGIQGIFLATSSLFALVGIAFFANWSILSNITASVLIYFTFPFRIGDRLIVENDPKYCGILMDVTLFYLKIQNDRGSDITIPANVAIQKIITVQSEKDWQRLKQQDETAEKAKFETADAV